MTIIDFAVKKAYKQFAVSGCSSGSFSCQDGRCIHPSTVCNKECDCDNCVDEEECYYNRPTTTQVTTTTTEYPGIPFGNNGIM